MSGSTFSEPFGSNTGQTRTQSVAETRRARQASSLVRSRSASEISPRTGNDERHERREEASTLSTRSWESRVPHDTHELRVVWFRFCQSVAQEFPRIRVDLHLMGGKPTVRGTTITVAQLQDLAAAGYDTARMCAEFEGRISLEDIQEEYARESEVCRGSRREKLLSSESIEPRMRAASKPKRLS